ncbi:MAG: exosortase K, partial [Tannerellaceae bacterium]|nr:exosortase K [Tannerellaceae bacterium]
VFQSSFIMLRKILYIGVSLLFFLLFRYWVSISPVERLDFLLWPVDKVVGFWFSSSGTFAEGVGYLHPDLHIVISKSCSGSNFFLTAFLMITFLGIQANRPGKGLLFPFSLLGSWLLTWVANSSRIISFLMLQRTFLLSSSPYIDTIHTFTGVVVYLTFLVLTGYFLRISVLKYKIQTHEKVA